MRIGGPPPEGAPATDVASALGAAVTWLGMRPGLVVIGPEGRSEQGVASLANWTAKTAHLLVDEAGIGPGDRVGIDAPPGWTTAVACLAAWWLGATVVGPTDATDVVVRHVIRPSRAPARLELIVGDAFDGTASEDDPTAALTWQAQPRPDRPPPPARDGSLAAVEGDGRRITQAALLVAAGSDGREPLGITAGRGDDHASRGAAGFAGLLAASVLRPLVTGAPTVVVLDAPIEAAAGEGVVRWLEAAAVPPID